MVTEHQTKCGALLRCSPGQLPRSLAVELALFASNGWRTYWVRVFVCVWCISESINIEAEHLCHYHWNPFHFNLTVCLSGLMRENQKEED